MKIQVNTHSSIEGSDALTLQVETTVRSALDRYGDRLTRVEAHLEEDDGATGNSQSSVRCLLEARPAGMDPVVVTASASTSEQACHDAARKMQGLLTSKFGRVDSRDSDATIRQNRH